MCDGVAELIREGSILDHRVTDQPWTPHRGRSCLKLILEVHITPPNLLLRLCLVALVVVERRRTVTVTIVILRSQVGAPLRPCNRQDKTSYRRRQDQQPAEATNRPSHKPPSLSPDDAIIERRSSASARPAPNRPASTYRAR